MNVANRIEIEKKVVRHLIRTMKAKGWIITRIDDGGEIDEDIIAPNETEAMETVFSVDECKILFVKTISADHLMMRIAYIVLGNDGYDCIADCSCSNKDNEADDFESIMDEIYDWAEQFA
jgi:hypothetical protein